MERNAFLQQVRQAVMEGNRAGGVPALPERGNLGYQGGGSDLVQSFCAALARAGGTSYHVPDSTAAAEQVLDIVQSKSARTVLLGHGPVLDSLHLDERLRDRQLEVIEAERADPQRWRESFFTADVGVSGVHHLIAETGTLVMATRTDEPRSVSLVPPVHIAVAESRQLLPDLFDLFASIKAMPACLTLITGPSKTGDIELKLVTGVHGPGEVHVVLIGA